MDYHTLIRKVDNINCLEEFVRPHCDSLIIKIEVSRRTKKVKMNRIAINERTEMRRTKPDNVAEYLSLLSGYGQEKLRLDNELQPLVYESSSEDESDLSCSPTGYGQIHTVIPGESILSDEIPWCVSLSKNIKFSDSKLLFFSTCLFRVSFGFNELQNQYYLNFSAAEKLKVDARVYCEFRVHDPTTNSIVMSRAPDNNYYFPQNQFASYGFDSFAGPEISSYVSSAGKLHLSILIASEVGNDGNLLGCSAGTIAAGLN